VKATTDSGAAVGIWHFDEGSRTTAHDSSGNGNNGTLKNGPTWVNGKSGKALSFDGVDDYVQIADSPSLELGSSNYTIMAWFKTPSLPSLIYPIVAKMDGWGGDSDWQLYVDLYGNVCYQAREWEDLTICTSGYTYEDGAWHQVAVTKTDEGDSGTALYVDGVLIGTGPGVNIEDGTIPIKIGANDEPYYFSGTIDEVGIWNRALSAEEIYQSYLGNLTGIWHFNEGSGTTAYDDSGNNYNGTLTNGPTWVNGKFGKALRFDGADDYVDLGTANLLPDGVGTVSVWVKLNENAIGKNNYLVTKGNDAVGFGWGVDIAPADSSNANLALLYGQVQWVTTGNIPYSLTNWHLITMVMKSDDVQEIYLDGVLKTIGRLPTTAPEAGLSFHIGDQGPGAGGSYTTNGTIDEVKVYNRVFGPTAAFTYSPASPTTDNTIQFTDQSTGNDGTVVSWSWDFGDGATSVRKNPTHKYTNPGTYSVGLMVTNKGGASDTEYKSINVVLKGGETGDGLEIFCIERRPNYPRYWALYTESTVYDDYLPYNVLYSTGLGGGQDSNTQRHPNEGDVVQYVAHVYNMSENVFSGDIVYQWYFDDGLIRESTWSGTIASEEKVEISLSLTWQSSWLTEPHPIKFKVVSTGLLNENCLQELVTYTDAMPMYVQVEKSYYGNFKRNTANVANPTTNSIVQWIQLHMIKFNNMFQEAGTKARINYDIIRLVDDEAPLPPDEELTAYGAFPSVFHYTAYGDDWRFGSCYYSPADDIDYAYLHEVGHQLGLIDLYWLNSGNPFNNTPYWWMDEDGRYDLMSGCAPYISTYHALALDSWLEYNRGYFGQYLYDVPENNRIKVIDNEDRPVANARIQIYQMGISEIGNTTAKFGGYTDSGGIFYLPNVSINESIVPETETGNQLRPNPFGYISMLGMNGVFLVKIQKDKSVFYEFLPITRFNNAYWKGNTSRAEYIIYVTPPTPHLISPPDGIITNDDTPTFVWGAVNDPCGVTYHIQIDDDSDFSSPVYSAIDIGGNAYTLPDAGALASGGYYWRVRAMDSANNVGNWSDVWTLTIDTTAPPTSTPTIISVSPSSFELQSGQSRTLTATLMDNANNPLADKTITWTTTAGSLSSTSGTTNYSGQVSVTYTAPSYETTVTVTASFAGDDRYRASTGYAIAHAFPMWKYATGNTVFSVSISSDGSYIAAGSDDYKVYLSSKDSSIPLWSYKTGGNVKSVTISSDGSYIAAGSDDRKVYLFSKDSSTPLWSYKTGGNVKSVAISSDGSYIAAGSDDHKVYLFSKDSSTPLWSYKTGGNVKSVAISSDGSYIAACNDGKVYLFSKDSSTPLWIYTTSGTFVSVSISSDGSYIAACNDGKVYLFSKDSSTPLWSYKTGGNVKSVAISSDGSYIAAGSDDDKVYLFSKDSSIPLWSYKTGGNVKSVTISSDGSYTAAGSEDKKVYLFGI
jgi:PKD repeat protein